MTEGGTWKLGSLPYLKGDFVPRRRVYEKPRTAGGKTFLRNERLLVMFRLQEWPAPGNGGVDCHRDPFAGRLEMQRESLRTRTDSIRRKMIEESWKQQFCSGWLDCSTLKEKAFEQQGSITEIESGGLVQFMFLI